MHDWIDNSGGSGGEFILTVSKEVFRVLGLNTEVTEQKKSKAES